jgi:hypothetical protein
LGDIFPAIVYVAVKPLSNGSVAEFLSIVKIFWATMVLDFAKENLVLTFHI